MKNICKTEATTPSNIKSINICPLIGDNCFGTQIITKPNITAPAKLYQRATLVGLSLRPNFRSRMARIAPENAAITPYRAAAFKADENGSVTIIMPINPAKTADHRTGPTLSPNSKGDNKVTNITEL